MNNGDLEFRKIPSLKYLYEVNENGTIVRNAKSKKQLKMELHSHNSKTSYYRVHIKNDSLFGEKPKTLYVHALVAECWLGVRPKGLEIDHIDRNSHNNDYRNLRYATRSEQMKNRGRETYVNKKGVSVDGIKFDSFSQASYWLNEHYNLNVKTTQNYFRNRRKQIHGLSVIYLNAETKHDRSTEQEIVH